MIFKKTPPLPALRAFAALARLGSINAAAEELSLTQGAVAHQIRALENILDVSLVERHGKRLILTEQGRIYGYKIRQALNDIADATQIIQPLRRLPPGEQVIRISAIPSFIQGWLLPRLQGFFKLYPNIRLHFHESMAYADLNSGSADCAIRFGHGRWPNLSTRPLMNDSLILVASPKLLESHEKSTITQILQLPILHSSENWASWLSSMEGVDLEMDRPQSRMEFTDSTQLLEAVRLGLGVALTRRTIADQLLQRNEIVQAVSHECLHTSIYSAVLPQSAPHSEAIDLFLGWLQSECACFSQQQRWLTALTQHTSTEPNVEFM